MKILITGANGFVGPYLVRALREEFGKRIALVLTSRREDDHAELGPILPLDVCNASDVDHAIKLHRPTHVVHLAAIAAISDARANPTAAWRVHVDGTLNLARSIMQLAPECVLLNIGSGQVYGSSAKSGVPLDENCLLAPLDDYSVTKAAADIALGALAHQGLKCIRMRPFNHTGIGQTGSFVVPAFAQQVARIDVGLSPAFLQVGNLEAMRDFLDVRDVATAYALAIKHSNKFSHGEVFNIASGEARSIRGILESLITKSRIEIVIEIDQTRMRPSDLPVIIGNSFKAQSMLEWAPKFNFEDTLQAVFDDCRKHLSQHL